MLVSRDEKSCLVVSYREVKKCIDSAFRWGSTLERAMYYILICSDRELAQAPAMGTSRLR